MHNMTKRGSTYYVRLIVPQDRWQDVGRATAARAGTRRDIVKSLHTKDYRQALLRRDAKLAAIRTEVDAALAAHGLPPLHGDWSPACCDLRQQLTDQALEARQALEEANDYRKPYYLNDDPTTGVIVSESISDRDFGADVVRESLSASAQRIAQATGGPAGQKAARDAYQQAQAIAFGTATPLGVLLDRWFPQLDGVVTKELIDRHHRALSRLGQHLAEAAGIETSDPEGYARSIAIERIDRKTAGHFREWLEKVPGVGPRVVGFHLSTMNTFWKWAQDVGYAEVNPWAGSTRGLKRKISLASRARGEKRPYTDAELVQLLTQARERVAQPKRSQWARVIYDMLRLAPLTGCRQNELASLTVGRVIRPQHPGQLWRISITENVSKTRSSVRELPLHPIAQAVIEQRLADLPNPHDADAMIFPECKPGGRDDKPGHYLSKRYATFLKSVLGEDNTVDFHSFRRCFATFIKQAEANGADSCSDLVLDHLLGHKPVTLATNTYAAKRFDWSVYDRAITEMGERGIAEAVLQAMRA
ncbi:tyrosine-type recombinase/integrase [Komagataeibacter xylinus]|uniref:tyrosine-type recombinase/integrase n=1 Tax=Komagataeibacter xylinus TaxID=28448 RepID=UPI00280B0A4A|nr:tyrosine-type recombinase/integrase [Komagataeibacter xylinus]